MLVKMTMNDWITDRYIKNTVTLHELLSWRCGYVILWDPGLTVEIDGSKFSICI